MRIRWRFEKAEKVGGLAKLPWRLGQMTMETGSPDSIEDLVEIRNNLSNYISPRLT